MKVLLLLLPLISAALAERAQVILPLYIILPSNCPATLSSYFSETKTLGCICLLLCLLILDWMCFDLQIRLFQINSPSFDLQVKYLGGITFLLRDR